MASRVTFSEYQIPSLSEAQLETLTLKATTYALSHGLMYFLPTMAQHPAPTSAIHAPLTLLPSPFPRRLFQLAQRLQRIYNVLYARIALDEEFLDSILDIHGGVGKVDEFIGKLWTGWRQLRNEGLIQPLQLGIYRSDYLLHAPTGTTREPLSLKQVEFNTITSSYPALSERTAGLHKYLHASTQYYNASPYLKDPIFPTNNSTAEVVEALAIAHEAYGVESSQILFVVQEGECNVFDQRFLEYELLKKHSIHVVRQSLHVLSYSATLDPITLALHVTPPGLQSTFEISTVYFRTGSNPRDYPTPAHYSTRFLLERSKAIKCPSIALQLAGSKKVQQVLTQPGMLERFLCDESRWGNVVFDEDQLDVIRSNWMAMWALDLDEDSSSVTGDTAADKQGSGISKARELASSLVLKPQREGGGNNVFRDDIPAFLATLPPLQRQLWIAMEFIVPPQGLSNYLVRADGMESESQGRTTVKTDVVSELGIFGWTLFGGLDGKMTEKEAGWLVRTKSKDTNEGGVHAGFGVLDSLVLLDD